MIPCRPAGLAGRSSRILPLIVSAAFVVSACATPEAGHPTATTTPVKRPRVVLVSIDGLRPEFYRSDRFASPNLHELARAGASAARVRPVFPSLTYPNHATLLTGVRPARHGVVANHVFDPEAGPREDAWYWYSKDVKSETLWHAAKEDGRSVAIIRWPSTVGASVDWLLPEIFYSPGIDLAHDFQRVLQNSDPVFLSDILRAHGDEHWPETLSGLDALAVDTAVDLIKGRSPDLVLVHLANVDYVQHKTGRDSAETAQAVAAADELIGRLRRATEGRAMTSLVIVGDHGFADYHDVLHVNQALADAHWLEFGADGKLARWSVVADAEGGQAAVYAKGAELAAKAGRLLKEKFGKDCDVASRAALDRAGANPRASFVLLAHRGFKFDGRPAKELVSHESAVKGQHGYAVDWPEMATGFIAAGPGIAPGRDLGSIEILDVAPTVARLMGLSFPAAERAPLTLR